RFRGVKRTVGSAAAMSLMTLGGHQLRIHRLDSRPLAPVQSPKNRAANLADRNAPDLNNQALVRNWNSIMTTMVSYAQNLKDVILQRWLGFVGTGCYLAV